MAARCSAVRPHVSSTYRSLAAAASRRRRNCCARRHCAQRCCTTARRRLAAAATAQHPCRQRPAANTRARPTGRRSAAASEAAPCRLARCSKHPWKAWKASRAGRQRAVRLSAARPARRRAAAAAAPCHAATAHAVRSASRSANLAFIKAQPRQKWYNFNLASRIALTTSSHDQSHAARSARRRAALLRALRHSRHAIATATAPPCLVRRGATTARQRHNFKTRRACAASRQRTTSRAPCQRRWCSAIAANASAAHRHRRRATKLRSTAAARRAADHTRRVDAVLRRRLCSE